MARILMLIKLNGVKKALLRIFESLFVLIVFEWRMRMWIRDLLDFSFSILASRVDTERVNAEIQREIQLTSFLIL